MKLQFYDTEDKVTQEVLLDEAEDVALATVAVDPVEWISNAAKERARVAMDDIVTKSGRGSQFTDYKTKKSIILQLKAEGSPLTKTGAEKEAEFQAKLEATRGTCNPPIDPIIEDPPIDPIKEGETP